MQHNEFEVLVKEICSKQNLPEALELLKSNEDTEVSEAAQSLVGQFALADVENEKRIYHVTVQDNDEGEEQEFVEHVMNEGDDLIKFAAWFFESMFEVKAKDTRCTIRFMAVGFEGTYNGQRVTATPFSFVDLKPSPEYSACISHSG